MAQEPCSHALPLRGSRDIRVAHQGDISFVLDPDHPQQASFLLRHPENDAIGDLFPQFVCRHVRFAPPIDGYHSTISLRSVVDDR